MSVGGIVVGLATAALLGVLGVAWRNHRRAAAAGAALLAQVADLQARLQQFTAGQRHFVDRFAHTIRTPLTIAVNRAELLAHGKEATTEVRGQARSLVDYLRHWADLCEGYLRLFDPAGASDRCQHTVVHCHDLVVGAVQRVQSLAFGLGLRLVAELAETDTAPLDLEVRGEPVLLTALLESLLRNGVKASPRGSSVVLRVLVRGSAVVFTVHDQGVAMTPAQLAGAFDWFGTDRAPLRHAAEPAMGLAIAHSIVLHHGGSIAVRNDLAGGAVFEVSLPRWHGEPAASPPSPPSSAAAAIVAQELP